MRVSIVGCGYVGLVTGACLAETGNTVMCMDKDVVKMESLKAGRSSFYEPALASLVQKNFADGRVTFTTDIQQVVQHGKIIFLAVGTPSRTNGEADLSAVEEVSRAIGLYMDGPKVIVIK